MLDVDQICRGLHQAVLQADQQVGAAGIDSRLGSVARENLDGFLDAGRLVDRNVLHTCLLCAAGPAIIFSRVIGMFPDPYAARVVDGVGNGSRHRADGGLAETFHAVEPARLEAVNIHLRRFRNVHDRGQAIRQITDGIVARSGKLAVPRNWFGRDLRAFNQRADHVRLGNQWIDDQSGVVRVDGSNEAVISCPGIHFHFHEAGAHALVQRGAFAAGGAAARLADQSVVLFGQRGETLFSSSESPVEEIDAVTHLELRSIGLQCGSCARQQVFPHFVCGIADGRALQRDGAAASPFVAQRRDVGVAPHQPLT